MVYPKKNQFFLNLTCYPKHQAKHDGKQKIKKFNTPEQTKLNV